MSKVRASSIQVGALIALTIALLIAAGCVHKPASVSTPERVTSATYLSETECQSCHAEVYRLHKHSHHSITLHVAERNKLQTIAPPVGPIPHTPYAIRAEGERFFFYNKDDAHKQSRIDYAMGSGKLAVTYVSETDAGTLQELRMSYYPSKKRWYVTPGQENMLDSDLGYMHESNDSRACILCHAVTMPDNKFQPQEQFFGVGCQSCHGPASAHVAAMQSGKTSDLHIERIGTWNATRINEMCGKCHRSSSQVGTSGNEITMTQRFQAYGLMQSPCFQKSGGRLSCVTCHAPHTDASRDARTYEAACLRCHSSSIAPTSDPSIVKSKVCPVNAKDKCIPCHMPTRKVFPVSAIPIGMADHLIWAYHKKTPTHQDRHAALSKDIRFASGLPLQNRSRRPFLRIGRLRN